MNILLEYLGSIDNNPNPKVYSVFPKVRGKNGKWRTPTVKEINSKDVRCDRVLCYKNGFVVGPEERYNISMLLTTRKYNGANPEITTDIGKSLYNDKVHEKNRGLTAVLESEEEISTVIEYTGPLYSEVNERLRSSFKSPITEEADNETIRTLKSALKNSSLDYDSVLFRGFHYNGRGNLGSCFKDKGFCSTSSSFYVGKDFNSTGYTNIILADEGSKALPIGNLSNYKSEKEVLLDSGSTFQILSIDKGKRMMVTKLLKGTQNLLPKDDLKGSPAQKYIESSQFADDLENIFREMEDGQKITAFDFRGHYKPHDNTYEDVSEEVPNPDFKQENVDEYNTFIEERAKINKKISEMLYKEIPNPKYDAKLRAELDEISAKKEKMKEDFKPYAEKYINYPNSKKDSEDFKELEAYVNQQEAIYKKLSIEYNTLYKNNKDKFQKMLPYYDKDAEQTEEYKKLEEKAKAMEKLYKEKYSNYDFTKTMLKTITQTKRVEKKMGKVLDISMEYAKTADKSCLLEFEKSGDNILLNELVGGKKIKTSKIPLNNENAKKIQAYIDDNNVMIY